MERDIQFDVRLQPRHLAKKSLSPEELEACVRALPDAAEPVVNPGALPAEASSENKAAGKTQRNAAKR